MESQETKEIQQESIGLKIQLEEIILLAKQTKYNCELLLAQSEKWSVESLDDSE